MSKKIKIWPTGSYPIDVTLKGGSSIDTYTKAEIDEKVNQLNSLIQELSNSLSNNFYDKNEMWRLYYNKDTVNQKIATLESLINQKTSAQEHYLKNKIQLLEGENMTLSMDDNNQTITFNATETPEPPEPTTDGIYSFNTTKKIYLKYNPTTIFAASGSIEYCEGDQYNNFPSNYDKSIPRDLFDEPIFFIFKNMDETTTNNMFGYCLANCQNFNQPLDFSEVSNLTKIGQGFLYGCIKFNSPITFKPNKIFSIGDSFMYGCVVFNNNFNNLFTPALQEIRPNFLMGCAEFNQNLDFSNITCNGEGGYNKIMLVNFMRNCYNFAQGKIIMGSKDLSIFKQGGYDSTMFDDIPKSCSSSRVNAPSYQIGFHFEGTNITKNQMDNFIVSTNNGNMVNVFQDNNEGPYKKIIVITI